MPPHYPRSAAYDVEWVLDSIAGPNVLWLAETLGACMELTPRSPVLDLGCGDGSGAMFLAREYGVEVWAVDRIASPATLAGRVAAAGLRDVVFPMQGDPRSLPFRRACFDAVVGLDSFQYFCTDERVPPMLAALVKAGGSIGAVIPGLRSELGPGELQVQLTDIGRMDRETLHDPTWWGRQVGRTRGRMVLADVVPDGWRSCADWYDLYADSGRPLSQLVRAEAEVWRRDGGRELGLVRVVASVV